MVACELCYDDFYCSKEHLDADEERHRRSDCCGESSGSEEGEESEETEENEAECDEEESDEDESEKEKNEAEENEEEATDEEGKEDNDGGEAPAAVQATTARGGHPGWPNASAKQKAAYLKKHQKK